MQSAVTVNDIEKTFGILKALDRVNFSIEEGSFFGLLGPNGAGKSTLINVMAGLTRANNGNIDVLGYDVQKEWRHTRKILGIVPQELAYDPFFTAREMLRLQSGYFGYGRENHAWIDQLLERLGLAAKADENLFQLSGGMKRRVMIAQALVHKPKVVVLDEPTAGVDVELRKTLWQFIRQLHRGGHTILLTTHYLEEAEALCDQIAIIDKGKLIVHEPTTVLLARYPFRFLHIILKERLLSVPEGIREKVVSNENNELVVRLHKEEDRIADILDTLYSYGIGYKDLRTVEPGLEEVFISLTGNKNV